MSKHFELLNYSEHGTVVDNVVYCCDVDVDEAKSEIEDTKEKKMSFQGLDDLLKRSAKEDKTDTGSISFERNKVCWAQMRSALMSSNFL